MVVCGGVWVFCLRVTLWFFLIFPCVPVVSTLSSGYVRAPLPYRMVNAGLCDYKKKKKKYYNKTRSIVQ